jgi:hypothetical protein
MRVAQRRLLDHPSERFKPLVWDVASNYACKSFVRSIPFATGWSARVQNKHEQASPLLPATEPVDDAYCCPEGANAMVIVTEWNEFRALDLDRVKSHLKSPVVVDLRNIHRPHEMEVSRL